MTRKSLFRLIFQAARFGNLGLFIGAGFSKAIMNVGEDDIALSWGDLLKLSAQKMGIEYKELMSVGRSFPEIASELCRRYAATNKMAYGDAALVLKNTIAQETAWFPEDAERQRYSAHLRAVDPSWIVTTNYDQIIECLLSGCCSSLGPTDVFAGSKGLVPVYHLHGLRSRPKDIVITQEDYVALFRPTEYRQVRLAMTIRESITCLIGYGLGDVNVQAALDWSQNVYTAGDVNHPREVVQFLWSDTPAKKPYRAGKGVLILEISSINAVFDEYARHKELFAFKLSARKKRIKRTIAMLQKAETVDVDRFIADPLWRKRILKRLSQSSVELVAALESFLATCFKETARRSSKTGAFEEYGIDLGITLDLLTVLPIETYPPALFAVAAANLNSVARYTGFGFGESWAAARVWANRKAEVSDALRQELKAIAKQKQYSSIISLLAK